MNVLAYDPYVSKEALDAIEREGYARVEDLDELVRRVDILSVHVPLTQKTRNLIDRRRLGLMKPGAFVVNFARGGIVDEEALYDALVQGRLAGAALDVFEEEPPRPDHPLLQLEQVILSPHCAFSTEDSRIKMSMVLAEGIEDVLEGRRPRFAVNL